LWRRIRTSLKGRRGKLIRIRDKRRLVKKDATGFKARGGRGSGNREPRPNGREAITTLKWGARRTKNFGSPLTGEHRFGEGQGRTKMKEKLLIPQSVAKNVREGRLFKPGSRVYGRRGMKKTDERRWGIPKDQGSRRNHVRQSVLIESERETQNK